MTRNIFTTLNDEGGHAITLPGTLAGMVGAILLAVGVVNGQDVLTIVGAVVLAAGLLLASLLQHLGVEYEIYGRLDKIEKSD